ncbi:MAG: helix-turn-helix transcriptional regulator [Lachnospiraceae bacterium]|nr:helix-turn-helix transcriptional regulator [Lachnospiraceae bacterium]
MTLGEQIRQARENKNLSQEELADQLGVSRQAVSKWENDTSIPQGINRELLSKLLELEIGAAVDRTEDVPESKKKSGVWRVLVWGVVVLLIIVLAVPLAVLFMRLTGWRDVNTDPIVPIQQDTGSDGNGQQDSNAEIPAIKSLQFYGEDLQIVGDVDGWYNLAQLDMILLQWEGGTPDNIKLFYRPDGEEYNEQTELLLTKNVLEQDTAALFDAKVLEPYTQGHFYFELDFRDTVVVSDTYNIYYESEYSAAPRMMYYVISVKDRNLTVDAVEWVDVPGSRFAELGLDENDAGSGFLIYNEEEKTETYALAEDCSCTILDWEDSYVQKEVSVEKLLQILAEREGMEIPYILTIEGNEIISITEQYVP